MKKTYLQIGFYATLQGDALSTGILTMECDYMPCMEEIEDEVRISVKEENGRLCKTVAITSIHVHSKKKYDTIKRILSSKL